MPTELQLDGVGVDFVFPQSQEEQHKENLSERGVLEVWNLTHRLYIQFKDQHQSFKFDTEDPGLVKLLFILSLSVLIILKMWPCISDQFWRHHYILLHFHDVIRFLECLALIQWEYPHLRLLLKSKGVDQSWILNQTRLIAITSILMHLRSMLKPLWVQHTLGF